MTGERPVHLTAIIGSFGGAVENLGAAHGIYAFAVPPEQIVEFCRFLKEHPALEFDFLSDICGVDHYPETPRFETV
ncbi:NADH:ubiquinone oxidoreductase subunit C [Sinorhizobium meliloti]